MRFSVRPGSCWTASVLIRRGHSDGCTVEDRTAFMGVGIILPKGIDCCNANKEWIRLANDAFVKFLDDEDVYAVDMPS